jgi:ubiquitin-like protein Nedd8
MICYNIMLGVHKDQIRLIFKGKPMVDEKSLGEQQVAAGSTVHMIMQMRGGY